MLTVFIFRELNHPGQRRRLELQKSNWFRLTKQKPLHVHHTFLYLALPSLPDYDVKLPNFTFVVAVNTR